MIRWLADSFDWGLDGLQGNVTRHLPDCTLLQQSLSVDLSERSNTRVVFCQICPSELSGIKQSHAREQCTEPCALGLTQSQVAVHQTTRWLCGAFLLSFSSSVLQIAVVCWLSRCFMDLLFRRTVLWSAELRCLSAQKEDTLRCTLHTLRTSVLTLIRKAEKHWSINNGRCL